VEILDKQPNWNFWVVWAGMTRGTSRETYEKLAANSRAIFMEDKAYAEGTMAYRKACGFEPLALNRPADFTGTWMLNEYESKVQAGPSSTPYKLDIAQQGTELTIKSTSVVEWADDEVTEQTLTLDGKDIFSTGFNNAPRVQHANWSVARDTLVIDSKVTFNFGNRPIEINAKDTWQLKRRDKKLVIVQKVNSRVGERTSILVYDKK